MISAIAQKAFGLIPWWLWPLALCVSVAGGVTAYALSQAEVARAQVALSNLQRDHAQATARAVEAARSTETQLRADATAASTQLAEEKQNAQILEKRLIADIRRGAQRLSIAARCVPGQAPADSTSAAGGGPYSARAELDPETSAALVAITSDGDTAIRERNACIQLYNRTREILN